MPVLGALGINVIQLCPQNNALIDEPYVDMLREEFKGIEIRLHANIQVENRKCLMDIVDFEPGSNYWTRLRDVCKHANSLSYSAHAGFRNGKSMADALSKQEALIDFLGIPVAMEGHYPTRGDRFLASSWHEWEMMLNSGLPFAVDLSHAAIIANLKGGRNFDLLKEMISNKNCLEVHISGNNEIADQHTPLTGYEWWWPLMLFRNPGAHIFYEGVFRI